MSDWLFDGHKVDTIDINNHTAFVYKITNLLDGRFYIGKKQTRFIKTKQKNGKKKRVFVESDWRKYWGSSEDLNADVILHGEQNFKREILYFCHSKSMASYLEIREQVDLRVLENPDLTYNRIINARVSFNHIKKFLNVILSTYLV